MTGLRVVGVFLAITLAPVFGCVGQFGNTASGSGGDTTVGNGPGSGGSLGSGAGTGSGGAGTGSGGAGTAATGGSSGTVVASDLPCDVASLIAGKCISCHGSPPAGGAPMALVNYADLTAPSLADPTKTYAVMSVSRMMNTTLPMPPAGSTPATSAEITALQNWISAGYPQTGCSTVSVTSTDAGTTPDPFSVAPTCTSGKNWTGGTNGSGSMEPGMACINCHASGGEGPQFTIAGTVYPTAHEPDLCDGVNGSTAGAQVLITDANGNVVTLTPNSAGNFYYSGAVATPFHAKVTYMGRERDMASAQTSGDCNNCHTQTGAMAAPGRIILP